MISKMYSMFPGKYVEYSIRIFENSNHSRVHYTSYNTLSNFIQCRYIRKLELIECPNGERTIKESQLGTWHISIAGRTKVHLKIYQIYPRSGSSHVISSCHF